MESNDYSHFTPRHLRNKILPFDESAENCDIEEVHETDFKLIKHNRENDLSDSRVVEFKIDEEENSKQYGVISIENNSLFRSGSRKANTRYSNHKFNDIQSRIIENVWFEDNPNFERNRDSDKAKEDLEDDKEEIKLSIIDKQEIKDQESIDFSGPDESVGQGSKLELDKVQRNLRRHITILCK